VRGSATPPIRVKRSPHLVFYWRGDELILRNYATAQTIRVNALVCFLLHFCDRWRPLLEIQRALGLATAQQSRQLIDRLVALNLLERSDRPRDPRVHAMTAMDPWNPEAGFFHTATKNVRFWPSQEARRQARKLAEVSAMPPPVKRYPKARTVDMPRPPADNAFARVLLARRTSRRYSSVPVRLAELSSILAFSAGVQLWARTDAGDVPLKTSPSGGARHPIECYVVARTVAGLTPGIYHYAADRHLLERIGAAVPLQRMRAYVPRSGYFAGASAMVFFTAVFKRQLWRYPYSRAYRAALIEAGHVCQTFLLTATSLGLAPYCVMGLADSLIEEDLGIDGITESVLYCAGVGRPPRGSTWAPLPRGTLTVSRNPRV
jgi:SagB-type dehydrogenase family enzyme